jgi:hypothetical protein
MEKRLQLKRLIKNHNADKKPRSFFKTDISLTINVNALDFILDSSANYSKPIDTKTETNIETKTPIKITDDSKYTNSDPLFGGDGIISNLIDAEYVDCDWLLGAYTLTKMLPCFMTDNILNIRSLHIGFLPASFISGMNHVIHNSSYIIEHICVDWEWQGLSSTNKHIKNDSFDVYRHIPKNNIIHGMSRSDFSDINNIIYMKNTLNSNTSDIINLIVFDIRTNENSFSVYFLNLIVLILANLKTGGCAVVRCLDFALWTSEFMGVLLILCDLFKFSYMVKYANKYYLMLVDKYQIKKITTSVNKIIKMVKSKRQLILSADLLKHDDVKGWITSIKDKVDEINDNTSKSWFNDIQDKLSFLDKPLFVR